MSSELLPSQAQNGNSSQAEIIRKNVSAITAAQKEDDEKRTVADRLAERITAFAGSMLFVWLHTIWFGVWILLNVGLFKIPHISDFDPFPFGLLTMVVSLEAIFLSTFVLIAQNRMSEQSEQRAQLDLHVNLLAEQKATKILELLDQVTKQLNQLNRFQMPHDPEVEALKISPEPQEVLGVLKETVEKQAEAVKRDVEEAVEEITGEVEAVRSDVREVKDVAEDMREDVGEVEEQVSAVAQDVERLKEQTGEQEPISLK